MLLGIYRMLELLIAIGIFIIVDVSLFAGMITRISFFALIIVGMLYTTLHILGGLLLC